jgi:hypothetical protein
VRTVDSVRAEYEKRRDAARQEIEGVARSAGSIAVARLAIFGAAAVVAWLAIGAELFSVTWVLLPLALFVPLIVAHERLRRRRRAAEKIAAHYEHGLARLSGEWSSFGSTGEKFAPRAHRYADDLDLFGRGSLFQLLSLAQTDIGERTLARWLLDAASAPVVIERQEAVGELCEELDLRESLATLGAEARVATRSAALTEWAEAPEVRFAAWERVAASVVAFFAVGSFIWWLAKGDALPFLLAIVAEFAYGSRVGARARSITQKIDEHLREVTLLRDVIATLGGRRFQSNLLRRLWGEEGTAASGVSELQRLVRLIDLADASRNQFFVLIGALLQWNVHVAFALERWRGRNRAVVRRWVESVGTFEAVSSLAGYAFEHPHDVFPEIVDGAIRFEADAIAHPLLPQATAVQNDVRLSPELQLLIVSGSNMSGKSTLLRSVGVNAVLAQCGSAVRARRLVMSPLTVAASIRIGDSLQEGASRFYAELTRVKTIVDLAATRGHLLFLLDEIFNGTNSHDRRIGAEAVLEKLVRSGAVGMVTTHDLALARLADSLPAARNVHFEDHLENGVMAFDYRLKEGVVTKSNALELMRAVGLEV